MIKYELMKEDIVAGVGLLVADRTLILPKFPVEDDKVIVESFFDEIGAPVPVALTYLSRLGWNTRLAAAIGDDATGDFLKRRLREEGVDTDFLIRQAGKHSGFAQIWLSKATSSRTIASSSGTLESLSPADIPREFFDGAKLLHIDGRDPLISVYTATVARELGIKVSYDAGNYKPGSENLLELANIVQAPRRFLMVWQGIKDMNIAAEKLRSFGPEIAIVTDGENGLTYSYEGGTFFRPAYRVRKVVDTNGAGDIFAGAFIHAYLLEKSLEDSIAFASAAAALKCTNLGKKNLPSEQQVWEFLN